MFYVIANPTDESAPIVVTEEELNLIQRTQEVTIWDTINDLDEALALIEDHMITRITTSNC